MYKYKKGTGYIYTNKKPLNIKYVNKILLSQSVLNIHMPQQRYVSKHSKHIAPIIKKLNHSLKLDHHLILAMAKVESNFNPQAISKKGALGIMQLMPQTAKQYHLKQWQNIEQNLLAGMQYYHHLLQLYKGNTKLALAAYNAGPTAVNKYKNIPPYKETQNYVKKVMRYRAIFANDSV